MLMESKVAAMRAQRREREAAVKNRRSQTQREESERLNTCRAKVRYSSIISTVFRVVHME